MRVGTFSMLSVRVKLPKVRQNIKTICTKVKPPLLLKTFSKTFIILVVLFLVMFVDSAFAGGLSGQPLAFVMEGKFKSIETYSNSATWGEAGYTDINHPEVLVNCVNDYDLNYVEEYGESQRVLPVVEEGLNKTVT